MARDLKQLAIDWSEHSGLRMIACRTVEQLAEHLEKVHKAMLNDELGPATCYLYWKQVQINKQLKKELEECHKKLQTQGK